MLEFTRSFKCMYIEYKIINVITVENQIDFHDAYESIGRKIPFAVS